MEHFPSVNDCLEELWLALRANALRRGADVHTAEDVAQETYLRAIESRPEDRGRLRAWFQVVGDRVLFETWRKGRNRRFREELAARPDHVVSPLDGEVSLLRRWVRELPEPYGSVVHLRFFEERTMTEIAEILGRSPEAVRSQLRRGLERLRRRLGEEQPDRERSRRLTGFLGLFGLARKPAALVPLGVVGACALVLWVSFMLPRERADALELRSTRPERAALASAEMAPPARGEPRIEAAAKATASSIVDARTIRGRVLDPGGRPVPGARVFAGSRTTHDVEAATDEQGRFEIAAAKHKLLWASHGDWLPSARCYLASVRSGEVDLRLGGTAGRGTLEVLDAAGGPVPGVRILFDPPGASAQRKGPGGFLEFPTQPPEAVTDELGRAPVLFPARSWSQALLLPPGLPPWRGVLAPPGEGEILTIRLAPSLTLRGSCRDPAGDPVAGASIVLLQHEGKVQRETVSALDGTLEVPGLEPGAFAIRVVEGGPSARSTHFQGVLAPDDPPLELTLDDEHAIRGQLSGSHGPWVGARIGVVRRSAGAAEGLGARTTWTDEEGRFRFLGCPLEPAHVLSLSRTAEEGRATRVPGIRPGSEESYFLPPPGSSAAIEVDFSGLDENAPRLVELRGVDPQCLVVLDQPSGPSRFRSEPLPGGEYYVTGWRPGLGAWLAGVLHHDADRPAIHTFPAPTGASLQVDLALFDGRRPEDVEVVVVDYGLDAYRTGESTRRGCETILEWDPGRGAFLTDLPPGECTLRLRGPGIVDVIETLDVVDGSSYRLELPVRAGFETVLRLRSSLDALAWWENLLVEAVTPTGSIQVELPSRDQRVVDGGCEFLVSLPRRTVELKAWTVPKDPARIRKAWFLRSGRVAVDPWEQVRGDLPALLEVRLEPPSSDGD